MKTHSIGTPDPTAMQNLLDAIREHVDELTARRADILDARYHAAQIQIDRQGYFMAADLPQGKELDEVSRDIHDAEEQELLTIAMCCGDIQPVPGQ